MTALVDQLWLRSLQKLTAGISHDLKGALNGASVNLEVVRTRSARETSTGADVHKFAATSAEQLGVVIRVTGALLSLGRAPRGPVEVSGVTRQLSALLDDMKTAAGGKFDVQVEGGMAAETAAPLNAVRLAIAESLLATSGETGQVSVRVRGLPTPLVRISPAADPGLSSEVHSALLSAGIRIDIDGHGISVAFPGPAGLPTEDE